MLGGRFRISRRRRRLAGLLACVGALVAAGTALADQIGIHYNAADQAAARRAVLKKADLGTAWSGGASKPDLTSDTGCPDFNPKQSDLVVTGAAASHFRHSSGLDVISQAELFQTARMVQLDWQRTAIAPQVLPCLRKAVAKELTSGTTKFVSLNRLAFPRLTAQTLGFRTLLDVTGASGTVRVLIDVIGIGRGRYEVTLVMTAPYASRVSVKEAEVRLARVLLSRTTS